MSILATLSREHRLFEGLIAGLRASAELGGAPGRERVAEALLVLLPSLERHDAIEAVVFGELDDPSGDLERRARELVQAQHEALAALRAEIEETLREHAQTPFGKLALLTESLASKLEWHLKTEELLLWPLLAVRPGRSVGRSLQHEADKSVRELEAAVASLAAAARGCVEGAP